MSSKTWIVKLTRQAEKDLGYWAKNNPKIFDKCLHILTTLENDPLSMKTTGYPKWLKGELTGCMSRRITHADRCVYQVVKENRTIKVLQMRFHYDDH